MPAENDGEIEIVTAVNETKTGIELKVKDTGSGIAPENIKKIFTPFFTTKTGNLGLGLAITYRIIDWHGGSINFDSQPGNGTTVTVKLPIKRRNGEPEKR
jgi:signal transduction histidine kinase